MFSSAWILKRLINLLSIQGLNVVLSGHIYSFNWGNLIIYPLLMSQVMPLGEERRKRNREEGREQDIKMDVHKDSMFTQKPYLQDHDDLKTCTYQPANF